MLAPFHAPTCKAGNATVSIIQPQFSCSWATCFGSVVTRAVPAGHPIRLMGLFQLFVQNGFMWPVRMAWLMWIHMWACWYYQKVTSHTFVIFIWKKLKALYYVFPLHIYAAICVHLSDKSKIQFCGCNVTKCEKVQGVWLLLVGTVFLGQNI